MDTLAPSTHAMAAGDYQVQVHILECRNQRQRRRGSRFLGFQVWRLRSVLETSVEALSSVRIESVLESHVARYDTSQCAGNVPRRYESGTVERGHTGRDLKSEDMNGLSDPYVRVKAPTPRAVSSYLGTDLS